jgi:hypothetical protein
VLSQQNSPDSSAASEVTSCHTVWKYCLYNDSLALQADPHWTKLNPLLSTTKEFISDYVQKTTSFNHAFQTPKVPTSLELIQKQKLEVQGL